MAGKVHRLLMAGALAAGTVIAGFSTLSAQSETGHESATISGNSFTGPLTGMTVQWTDDWVAQSLPVQQADVVLLGSPDGTVQFAIGAAPFPADASLERCLANLVDHAGQRYGEQPEPDQDVTEQIFPADDPEIAGGVFRVGRQNHAELVLLLSCWREDGPASQVGFFIDGGAPVELFADAWNGLLEEVQIESGETSGTAAAPLPSDNPLCPPDPDQVRTLQSVIESAQRGAASSDSPLMQQQFIAQAQQASAMLQAMQLGCAQSLAEGRP